MKKYYLKDGELVHLIKEFDNQYLVEKIYIYQDYDGEYEDLSGVKIIVDKIYEKPPIEKKYNELSEILTKIDNKNKVLSELEREILSRKNDINKINTQIEDIEKWKIDLSVYRKAKELVFFSEDSMKLIILNPREFKEGGYKFNFSVNVFSGKINHYGISIDWEGRAGYSHDRIDIDFGILIDPSEDKIKEFVHKRFIEFKDKSRRDYYLNDIPDIYCSDEIKKRKKEIIADRINERIKSIENSIEEAKEEISKKKIELKNLNNQ